MLADYLPTGTTGPPTTGTTGPPCTSGCFHFGFFSYSVHYSIGPPAAWKELNKTWLHCAS